MSRVSSGTFALAVACLAISASPAAAVIIISPVDAFGDAQYQAASGPNGTSNSSAVGRTVGVTGGLVSSSGRSVYVEKSAGSNNIFMRVEALNDDTEGAFSVSRASGIGGKVLVQWDGGTLDTDAPATFDPTSNLTHLLGGGAGIDLTAGGADGLLIRVLNADLANQQLQLTLFGANGGIASEQTVILPSVIPPGSFDALFPFAGFTLRSGAGSLPNPNAVYALTLALTGPSGADITLSTLATYAVPEPATLSLFGLGTAGLLASARRRRRSQALEVNETMQNVT